MCPRAPENLPRASLGIIGGLPETPPGPSQPSIVLWGLRGALSFLVCPPLGRETRQPLGVIFFAFSYRMQRIISDAIYGSCFLSYLKKKKVSQY